MGYLRGALHGLIIGTAIGVLIAPQEGSKSRQQLQRALRTAQDGYQRAQQGVRRLAPTVQGAALPIVAEYRAAMDKQFGNKEYSFTSLESYIGAKIMVEGMRRAGAKLTRESFMRAMDGMVTAREASVDAADSVNDLSLRGDRFHAVMGELRDPETLAVHLRHHQVEDDRLG